MNTPNTGIFQTERLVLRPPQTGDLAAIFAIHSDPETNLYNPSGPMKQLEEAEDYLARWQEAWQSHGFGYWAIASLAEPESIIGFGGITPKIQEDRPFINLYFRFATQAWGKGYAQEMGRQALKCAFEHWQLPQVEAIVRSINTPSIKALERLGMRRIGLIDDIPPLVPSLHYLIDRQSWG
jgi:RimJ/RimL family protein N-acetyltransferase